MERYYLKLREICLLSALLALAAALTFGGYFGFSSWDVLFRDVPEGVVPIPSVRMIAEWPVTPDTLQRAMAGDDITDGSFEIKVNFQSTRKAGAGTLFRDQADVGFGDRGFDLSGDLSGTRYAFFFDVAAATFGGLTNPYVYFYGAWSPYELYINGQLQKKVSGRMTYVGATPILAPPDSQGKVRVLWVVTNNRKDQVPGLNFQHGLSIRSEKAMSRSFERLPIQWLFPHIAAGIAFLAFGIIAISFAATAGRFLDIWAFGAFCMTMALFVWGQTPMFYEGFLDNARKLVTIRALIAATSIVSATILSLAFFRLEGRYWRLGDLKHMTFKSLSDALVHPFKMTLLSTFVLCAVIVGTFWPMTTEMELPYAISAINTRLAWVLAASQGAALFFGFRDLLRTRSRFVREGLEAQVQVLNRRIVLAVIFAVSMGMMLVVYLSGFGAVSLEAGTDVVLIAAIFPALAMLLMFFWMVSSGNRFYARFAPRLGQIDHEVLAFGPKALDRRYFGSLLVFDLAGMKKLNLLRGKGAQAESAVDHLISTVEHDLADLIQKGRVTHRYKSNGDEFIFAMRARDEAAAWDLTRELFLVWQRVAADKMKTWRDQLVRDMAPVIGEGAARSAVDGLEIHVLMTTMTDMKITIKGGIDRPEANPDFIEPRFTSLSALFKPSRHNRVALHQDDAKRILADPGTADWCFEDQGAGMGLLSWPSDAAATDVAAA